MDEQIIAASGREGRGGAAEDLLRDLMVEADGERRLKGNPYQPLPLHRLLATGRDNGPATPGLAMAVGEALAGGMLEDGLSEERQSAVVQAVGERVLGDRRLLGLDGWPEHDLTRDPRPAIGCLGELWRALGRRLAEGLPLEWHGSWQVAADELGRLAVDAYQRLEGKQPPLWNLPQNTPGYLQPREDMRSGQTLADPALRELVERGWDATVAGHLTAKANSHPASREDDRDRWSDAAIDDDRLQAIRVKIGERVLGQARAAIPEGIALEWHERFLESVGAALIEAAYAHGRYRIDDFDRLWEERDWHALVARGLLAPEEGEELRMWSAKEYRTLNAKGVIDLATCELYEQEDARRTGGR